MDTLIDIAGLFRDAVAPGLLEYLAKFVYWAVTIGAFIGGIASVRPNHPLSAEYEDTVVLNKEAIEVIRRMSGPR